MKTLYESILDTNFDADDIVIIPAIQDKIARSMGWTDYKTCPAKLDITTKGDTAIINISSRTKAVELNITHSLWDEILKLLKAKYLTLIFKRKNGTLSLYMLGDWEGLTLEADNIFMYSSSRVLGVPGDATQVRLKKSVINTHRLTMHQTELTVEKCKLNYDDVDMRACACINVI